MAVAPSRTRSTSTVAAAVAGVVVGHDIGYLLAFGDARRRAEILHSTGHGYWSFAGLTAVGAGALGVLAVVAHGARANPTAGKVRPSRLVRWSTLAPLQVGLFVAMEVLERLVAHAPLTGLAEGRVFALGVVIQLLVAAAATAALWLTERVAACLVAALAPAVTWPDAAPDWLVGPTLGGRAGRRLAARSRAPPAAAFNA